MSIFVIMLCIFYPKENAIIFAQSNHIELNFSSTSFVKFNDSFLFTSPNDRTIYTLKNNELNTFGIIGGNDGEFSEPTLITNFDNGFAVYDADIRNLQFFDENYTYKNKIERFDDMSSIKNISSIYAEFSTLYALNYENNSLYYYNNNLSYLTKLTEINEDITENSKLYVKGDNIIISNNSMQIIYSISNNSFQTNNLECIYSFYDCKHNLHNFNSSNFDLNFPLEKPLDNNSIFFVDEENGDIYIFQNNFSSTASILYSYNDIIDNIFDFEKPIELENFKLTDLNNIKNIDSKEIFASPYSKNPLKLLNGCCIKLGEYLDFSYIAYFEDNSVSLAFTKTNNLTNLNLQTTENQEYISLSNFTQKQTLPFYESSTVLKKGERFISTASLKINNDTFYILNDNDTFYFVNENQIVKNDFYTTKIFNQNATIKSNTEIFSYNMELYKTTENDLPVEIMSQDENYIYFRFIENDKIIYAIASKNSLVEKDNSVMQITILLILIVIVLSISLVIILKPKKNKNYNIFN